MILFVKITPLMLLKFGKNHKWGNHFCDKCKRNMWGHGHVSRYFSEVSEAVWLKRYRCPTCTRVITTRPESYWKYLRNSIATIFAVIRFKISEHSWLPKIPRQRGGHWLRRFTELAKMENQKDLAAFCMHCKAKELFLFPQIMSSQRVN